MVNNLENKKKMWAAAVKNELSLYDFLQTNFYNE